MLGWLFFFSFLLNFVWESFHAVFYYKGHNIVAMDYVPMMAVVSVVDALIILGIYFLTGFLWRDFLWLKDLSAKKIYSFFLIGFVTAGVIEYAAVFVFHWWSYSPRMPTVGGIGLSPLVQLSSTGILTVWLTQRVLNSR